MPLETDPLILRAVQLVYTTDLGLSEDWTDAQRNAFISDEAEKITWMVWARAGTLGEQSVEHWQRRHGSYPLPNIQSTLRITARAEALKYVLQNELYELIPSDEDWEDADGRFLIQSGYL
jgi:hypothetical protein